MPKKLTSLDGESKSFLLSKTPYILPDNPSSKGFSAFQIKSSMYGGYVVLYEWLKRMGEETQSNLDYVNESLDVIKDSVGGAGMLFVPAMQSSEPDEAKVKVWLETDTLSFGDADHSEELSFGDTSESESEELSFGDSEAEALTFGE